MRDYSVKIARLKAELAKYEEARDKILATGAQSWRIRNGEDSREFVVLSLEAIEKKIEVIEWKMEQLEGASRGRTSNGVRVRPSVL